METQPQQLALLVDFVASLPPAVVELLRLVYDSNLELIQHLEAKKNIIKQLKLAHAAALDQRDQQIEDLKALVSKLQQQYAQDPQAVPAAAPPAPAQPAGPSADTLQAQHADADAPAASTKRTRAAAHESEDQLAAAAAECPPPERVHLGTPGTPASSAAAAAALAAPAAQQEAAAAAASLPAAAAAAPARSIRALSAGTLKLGGSKSPTEPAAHQQQQQPQQPSAGQAAAAVHVKTAAGAAPVSGDDQVAAPGCVSASAPGAGQQQHHHQQGPQLAAGPDPNKAAPKNPNKPVECFDPQQAYAFVSNFLQQHRSVTTSSSTGRAPSSTEGTRGPSSTGGGGAAAAAAPRLAHSDGGSTATVFDPSLAAQYVSRQLARLSGGGMQVPCDVAGAPRAAAATAGAADLAAASAAAVQAASQLLATGLPFSFNAAPHRGQVHAAGYGPPAMYDPSTSMQQHMLGPLPGYTVPVSTGQHRSASAQPLGYAAAAGQLFGGQQRPFSAAAAAAAAAAAGGGGLYSGYGAGAAEVWQQHPGSMMGAAAAGPAAAAAAGWEQLAEAQAGAAGRRMHGSTGADRRSSRGDDQPLSNAEANWQREIERKVPASVQDTIRAAWLGEPSQQQRRLLPVTCNGVFGTFFVDAHGEPLIRTAGGQELKPAQFERECGKGQSKDPWRTIRVPGYQGKNGAIQLGQFCWIAGVDTGRRSSSM